MTAQKRLTPYALRFTPSGFTLIELLVSIAIIGILATLALANFNAARQRGRDAQRKADLRNVQTALRTYYNDNGSYPTSNTANQIVGCGPKTARTACPWGGAWATSEGQTYMGTLPRDPLDQATTTAYDYRYVRSDPDIYTLQACLENKSDEKGKTTTDTGWCPSGWMYEVKP